MAATPMLPTDPDILVLGAGAAGIAATRECARLGLACTVLEARGRVGGRAHTDLAALGAPFDLGATWLHAAGSNPLTPLARSLGFRTLDHDATGTRRRRVAGGWATPAQDAAFDAAYDAWLDALRAAPPEPDPSVAEFAPRGGEWDATIAAWEGPTIAAAELRQLGLRDFLRNQLAPPNLLVERGQGTLLTALAEGLPVALGTPVTRLSWGARGVRAEGPRGTLAARAAIVTLPAGVLAGDGVRFDPPLPADTEAALDGLPMGLLSKVGLRATGADRLDLPPLTGLDRQVGEGEARMTFVAWPFGRAHLEGFVGGDLAWALEREGPGALAAHALDELVRLFGGRARRAVTADGALESGWGADPWSRGAYSHARPGMAAARATLGRPLAGGRLVFAGEHCHETLAGTLGGAWESGVLAARRVASARGGVYAPAAAPYPAAAEANP